MPERKHLLDLLDEIRAIGQLGLNYSKDPYDIERYKRLLNLASENYADMVDFPSLEIKERFLNELGYITPKLGVQGILFNEDEQILLEKRKDDHSWGLPSGWAEVGETPEQSIIREFNEETNLEIIPITMLGIFTRLPGQFNQPHTSVHLLYYCKLLGGELKISHESLEMRYRNPEHITKWHKDHEQQVALGVNYWKTHTTHPRQ